MGAPAEILDEIFTVIEGGATVGTSAEIIQFPSDNGANTFTAIRKTYQGTNGTGLNYWVSAVASGASAISAGALMLTVSIPEFIALAVPCLGIAVGTAFYNIDPDGWTSLALKISNAGYTIQNKVVAFMTEKGILNFPPDVIQLLIQEMNEKGLLDGIDDHASISDTTGLDQTVIDAIPISCSESLMFTGNYISGHGSSETDPPKEYAAVIGSSPVYYFALQSGNSLAPYACSLEPFTLECYTHNHGGEYHTTRTSTHYTFNNEDIYLVQAAGSNTTDSVFYLTISPEDIGFLYPDQVAYVILYGEIDENLNKKYFQKGANIPDPEQPFPLQYPDWIPFEFPDIPGWQIPEVYPVQYPSLLPPEEPYQEPAQDPQADPDAEAEKGVDALEDPNKNPANNTDPSPTPDPDPDPQPEPDPLPDDDINPNPDPIEPDPTPGPSPIIPVPVLPSTVSSSKLFTVYNPTSTQLDSLGGYLWDDNLIEILKKIWQNPLDGIIGLSQVYCTPTTGSTHNIILGYLDSGVSSKVVTDQFKTIDCGSVSIPELNQNATDYNPYTSIHLYLPFIGITELDVTDFMNGSINVKYHIDVYTGSCLAEVKVTRSPDVPNGGIVYTFSGNCSQQLPLTSGEQKGMLSALMSAVGIGLGVASGGALGAVAVAGGVGNMLSREMLHVSHSGNLSANSGIMGQKKPYIIINRQRPYNANGYNRIYGFPINKTVFLGNCTGYVKVKKCRLTSAATDEEKTEIETLLQNGVIM